MKKILSLVIVILMSTSLYSQTISLNGEFVISDVKALQRGEMKIIDSGKYYLASNFDFRSKTCNMSININSKNTPIQYYSIAGKNVTDGGNTVNIDLLNNENQPMKFKITVLGDRYMAMFPWMPGESVGMMFVNLTRDDKLIIGIN